MQRSSENIGTIAAAFAKAQAELTNPERSLMATIRTDVPGGGVERSFRYAPLSSGLEIVRKTLSQQQIATVQATAADLAAGPVNLTTVLAHSSGDESARTGQSAPSAKWQRHIGWGRRSPMPGATRFSPWSGSPGRTTSMLLTSTHGPLRRPNRARLPT
jgi:hypothetical protein